MLNMPVAMESKNTENWISIYNKKIRVKYIFGCFNIIKIRFQTLVG